MEKEIYEQPRVLDDILTGRVQNGAVVLEEFPADWLQLFASITLSSCGTSYHATLVGSYLLERLARVPTKVKIASGFRYRQPVLDPRGLFVVISQSGETADTLEALKLAKAQGLATLALCNSDNSSIVHTADKPFLLRAGIEKDVASTKAFSAQVMTLWLLALYWAQAKRYLHGHGFSIIGRNLFYPLALEGALKLKEISYLHAEGYPAGEMKHGPIALAYDIIQIRVYDHPMLEFFEMLGVVQFLAIKIEIRLCNDVEMPRNLAKSVTVA